MVAIRQKPDTYALTMIAFQRHRHFQREANAELFIATLFRYRDAGKFMLHAFAVMPDHVHLMVTPAIDVSTAHTVQFIKGGYSHAVREQSPGEIWQAGCHEHRVRDAADFEAQKRYIANNPERKNFAGYKFVHTMTADAMDPLPPHLA